MMNIQSNKGSIYGDADAWEILARDLQNLSPSKIFILTDTNAQNYCIPHLIKKLPVSAGFQIIVIPAGEPSKTIHSCLKVWEELSRSGADRKSLLINLGGGVVSDLGGFVASAFKRGIPFINIPTTLLAMVDASVGGKNGVDLGTLKNQIGVIRNPQSVIVDVEFLKTLPDEQITSGYAEMLKHGLIHSEAYWNKVAKFDLENISEAKKLIWESIEIKNDVVTEDPTEENLRKTLNYGHTLGHAIESYLLDHPSKPALLHGEAIAIGMILATYISSELIAFPKTKLHEITSSILRRFPKTSFKRSDIDAIIALLIYDKKNADGKVFFVLLHDFGNHQTDCQVPNELILKAFDFYKNF
jgi:3-dehydroquinate synthase